MATVLSHPAVPLGLGLVLGSRAVPVALLVMGCVGSVLPDLDAIGFWLGVPYEGLLGHRGLTHSFLFASWVAALAAGIAGRFAVRPSSVFLFVFASTASHGILDALTNGGMGIAFLSPLTNNRYFLPWRVLEVSPISFSLGRQPPAILSSEILYVWLPCMGVGLLGVAVRNARRPARS
jgi:inner membrane protein